MPSEAKHMSREELYNAANNGLKALELSKRCLIDMRQQIRDMEETSDGCCSCFFNARQHLCQQTKDLLYWGIPLAISDLISGRSSLAISATAALALRLGDQVKRHMKAGSIGKRTKKRLLHDIDKAIPLIDKAIPLLTAQRDQNRSSRSRWCIIN